MNPNPVYRFSYLPLKGIAMNVKKYKKFLKDHKIATSVVAGAFTGYLISKLPAAQTKTRLDELMELYITPEQISQMILGGGHVTFDTPAGTANVHIVPDTNL